MITCPTFHIDSFTSQPFTGNPAAVCLLEQPADERWMQAVAAEMNVAETAFVVCGPAQRPITEPMGLRWFSPVTEVDLCGHATLAAAHALWESGRLSADRCAL